MSIEIFGVNRTWKGANVKVREDISHEAIRDYYYLSGHSEHVFEPKYLTVDDMGQHIIETKHGKIHLIPIGWIKLDIGKPTQITVEDADVPSRLRELGHLD